MEGNSGRRKEAEPDTHTCIRLNNSSVGRIIGRVDDGRESWMVMIVSRDSSPWFE